MRKTLIALATLCSFSATSYAQVLQESSLVNLVCSNDAFDALPPQGTEALNVRSTCATGYTKKFIFYLVKIRSGSTFTFEAQSFDHRDYDFLSWKNPSLPDIRNITVEDINSLPPADRGNRNTASGSVDGKIGLRLNAPTLCQNVAGDGFERHYDVQPGDIILIGIDRFGSNTGFNISFGGDAVLDCSITVPGDNLYACDTGDGTATWDLAPIGEELMEDDPALYYRIYSNQEDAEAGTNNNLVTSPFTAHKDNNPNPLYFRVENFITGDATITRTNFNVVDPPNFEDFSISFCDTDAAGPGSEPINLPTIYTSLVDGREGYSAEYYGTREDAEAQTNALTNAGTFVVSNNTKAYIRIKNEYDCYTVVEVTFNNNTDSVSNTSLEYCDSLEDGLGVERVNLRNADAAIVGELRNVTVTYYPTRTDAENGTNAIADPYSYLTPFNSTVYAVVANLGGCNSIAEIDIRLRDIDGVTNATLEICDSYTDGLGTEVVDLTAATTQLANGMTGTDFIYYANLADATANVNPIADPASYTLTVGNSVYVRVINAEGCSTIAQINFSLRELTGANNAVITFCDTPEDGQGVEVLDLTTAQSQLGSGVNNALFVYYPTEQDALNNTNPIADPTAYTLTIGNKVYVRVVDPQGCSSVKEIDFQLTELAVSLGDTFAICEANVPITATTNIQGEALTYKWSFNGQVVEGATQATYNVTVPGTYAVEVVSATGCRGTQEIVITEGVGATITDININEQVVTINANSEAMPLQYSLDGVNWQDTNVFNHVAGGEHVAYVRNAEGCISSREFSIFAIPTMFTPNGDGINDTWRIVGIEMYAGSSVEIYDRGGRLLVEKKINSNVIWDGFYADGKKAPSTDYWYVIKLTDGRKFTGSVTVKSRVAKDNNN